VELKFIGDRSSIFETNIITPSGKLRAKNDKNAPKISQNARKIAFLCIFRIYSVNIFEGGGLTGMAPVPPPPVYAPAYYLRTP